MLKKFIITESDKSEILKMYGLISEEIQLPITVSGTYTASNCDELHAFQSTSGKVIGNMNVLVGNKLDEIYKSGINPKPIKVDVKVNGMTVNWSVLIDKSNDGNSWVGFTSRGAGCGADVINRAESKSSGNDINSAKSKIENSYSETNIKIEVINDFIYNQGKGNNGFRQVFYRYTKPIKYPSIGSEKSQLDVGDCEAANFIASEYGLDELNVKFKTWIKEELLGCKWSLIKMSLNTEDNKVKLLVTLEPTKDGFRTFSILFNPKGSPQESKNNALSKNPGSKIVSSGELNFKNKDYEYHLIGLK